MEYLIKYISNNQYYMIYQKLKYKYKIIHLIEIIQLYIHLN
jgi:hypothetical protein